MPRDGHSAYRFWILVFVLALAACRRQDAAPTFTPTSLLPTATLTPMLATATPTPSIYVVQPGDSLSAIALKYDMPVEVIAEANGIQDPNVIHVGQKLIIPGPTSIPTATAPPTLTPTPHIPPKFEIVDVIGRGAPASETVVIANRGHSLSLEGWTLRDTQGNVFVFPKLYLASGAEVRIHTAGGENAPLHLYWNRDTPVWEEPGDSAVLADQRGVVHASRQLD